MAQPLGETEGKVWDRITLLVSGSRDPGFGWVAFDNVKVSSNGRLLFIEDFEAGEWSEGWDNISGDFLFDDGWVLQNVRVNPGLAVKTDESRQDFSLEADLGTGTK